MSGRRQRSAIGLVPQRMPRTLAERGRIFWVEDVQKLYGFREDGRPRRSRDYILQHFAPEFRVKEGKSVYWWEADALAWWDQQRGVA